MFAHPRARQLCDWLATVTLPDGGLPFALPIEGTSACAPFRAGADPTIGATVRPFMISLYAVTERLARGDLARAMSVLCAGGPVGTAPGQGLAGALADHGAVGFSGAAVAALTAFMIVIARPLGRAGRPR